MLGTCDLINWYSTDPDKNHVTISIQIILPTAFANQAMAAFADVGGKLAAAANFRSPPIVPEPVALANAIMHLQRTATLSA